MDALFNYKVIIFVVAGSLLPVIFWLWFWLREDARHPEPKRLIARAFVAGALSVFLAYYLEKWIALPSTMLQGTVTVSTNLLDPANLAVIGKFLFVFFTWALAEEFAKYVAALASAFGHREFNEPVDAMIYMITAALGFAALENAFFLLESLRDQTYLKILMGGNLRFLGATLLHILSSAFIGAVIAATFYWRSFRRALWIAGAIITAALLHALFNFFIIINNGSSVFRLLLTLWLAAICLIVVFELIKNKKTNYVVQG